MRSNSRASYANGPAGTRRAGACGNAKAGASHWFSQAARNKDFVICCFSGSDILSFVQKTGYSYVDVLGPLTAASRVPSVQAGRTGIMKGIEPMFYRACLSETGVMWDVWLYHHAETYYLYYLAHVGELWDNISMATSADGVHWREVGRVLTRSADAKWMGTGSTWESPDSEEAVRFFMNFSEWKGRRQNIYFAESQDLVHWTRLEGDEYRFVQDERWYKKNGRWDTIWTIARPGGGLYGYWTASPKKKTGGAFGFGESLDGIHWKALAPPKVVNAEVEGITREGEVGAIEKIGDRYYMMLGRYPVMVTLVADKPEGPFDRARKNYKVLAGHTYYSRFFRSPNGMLVCHFAQARTGEVFFSPLKAAVLDDEGTLRLGWWHGNARMKHEAIEVRMPDESEGAVTMLGEVFDMERGVILEGRLDLPEDGDAGRRGLYVDCGSGRGAGVLIDNAGRADLGSMNADGAGFSAEKTVDREMGFSSSARFRLLVQGSLMEFYLDDVLMECFSLPGEATGGIGLIRGERRGAIGDLHAWR